MKKYLPFAAVTIKDLFRWRANVILQSTMFLLPLLGYFFFFKLLYTNNFHLGNYNFKELFTYYFWALLAYTTMPFTGSYEIVEQIKTGVIVHYLSKPINFVYSWIGLITGGTIAWFFFFILSSAPVIFFLKNYFIIPTPQNIMLGALFLILGYILSLFLGLSLSLTAFFVGDPYGVYDIYVMTLGLLGGAIIPADLLPKALQYLPFKYIYFTHARAFTGGVANVLKELTVCVSYILIFWLLVKLLWTKGLKRYEAFGG
ncbi:MAG: ABC-2 family transporter protein [bacterium]|nr:ABC-2 family transporter protein [bacterium]